LRRIIDVKKLCSIIAAAIVLILAGSCVTTKVWDETYPPEQSATVWFYQMTVKSYNGIEVKKWASVVIPSGEANIGGDVHIAHAGVGFLMKDAEFTCYLEAGKVYSIIGAAEDRQWGVKIYEGKTPKPETFLEFIPFKDQPDTFR
jgi:hypothetical protein